MIKKPEPTLIRPKLSLLERLIVLASLVLAASHPAAALDAVSMQLKWKHQFQFAGYYQALEQVPQLPADDYFFRSARRPPRDPKMALICSMNFCVSG